MSATAGCFTNISCESFASCISKFFCLIAEILCRFFDFPAPSFHSVFYIVHAFLYILPDAVHVHLLATHFHFFISTPGFWQYHPQYYICQYECTAERTKNDIGEKFKIMSPANPAQYVEQNA